MAASELMGQFDPKWPHGHVTRTGKKARIICTDATEKCPIVALVEWSDGSFQLGLYGPDGKNQNIQSLDLLNAPAPKHRVWLVLNAPALVRANPIGAVYEYIEGHGMSAMPGAKIIGPIEIDV